MVYLYLVISLIAGSFSFNKAYADINVRGQIVLKDSVYYFRFENNKTHYSIIAFDEDVAKVLSCLKDGDFISGEAKLVNGTHISLKSIEYVGLQELIANWRNDNEFFNFSDFKTFYYWQFNKGSNRFRGPFPYHYILSPNINKSSSCSWKMFITNETEVVFALLKWTAIDQIRIDIYDSNNGEILMTKHLIQSTH